MTFTAEARGAVIRAASQQSSYSRRTRVSPWRTTINDGDDASSLQQGSDNETFGDSPIYAPTPRCAT